MSRLELILCSLGRGSIEAWRGAFRGRPGVEIHPGDALEVKADALVCPGDSFGLMEGGIEGDVARCWGKELARAVQAEIRQSHRGELPVGMAVTVPTTQKDCPRLIYAPIYRIPEEIGRTVNVYLALRATLLTAVEQDLARLAIPPLGVPIGRMPTRRMARQMRAAVDAVLGKAPVYPTGFVAGKAHQELLG